MKLDPMQWLLFDVYKIDYGYEIEIFQNGIINARENNALTLNETNFLATRRKNLKGIHIPCGLVVIINFYHCFKNRSLSIQWKLVIFCYFSIIFLGFRSKIAYPEKFTYVDDPMTSTIDTFTKAYVKLGENLREDLNMTCDIMQVYFVYFWLLFSQSYITCTIAFCRSIHMDGI